MSSPSGLAGVLRHYGVVTSRGTVICPIRVCMAAWWSRASKPFPAGVLHPPANGRYSRSLTGIMSSYGARRHLGKEYDLFGLQLRPFRPPRHRRKPTPMQVARRDRAHGRRHVWWSKNRRY
jgi:hypothetical protein